MSFPEPWGVQISCGFRMFLPFPFFDLFNNLYPGDNVSTRFLSINNIVHTRSYKSYHSTVERFYTSDCTWDDFFLRPIRIQTKFHTLMCDYPSVLLYQGLLVYAMQINISSSESDVCGVYIACCQQTEFMSLSCSQGGFLNICVKRFHGDNCEQKQVVICPSGR
jgi:hypothetical protein